MRPSAALMQGMSSAALLQTFLSGLDPQAQASALGTYVSVVIRPVSPGAHVRVGEEVHVVQWHGLCAVVVSATTRTQSLRNLPHLHRHGCAPGARNHKWLAVVGAGASCREMLRDHCHCPFCHFHSCTSCKVSGCLVTIDNDFIFKSYANNLHVI